MMLSTAEASAETGTSILDLPKEVLTQVLMRLDSSADISSLSSTSRSMLAAVTADHFMLAQWLCQHRTAGDAMILAARKGGADVMLALLQRFGLPAAGRYQGSYQRKALWNGREIEEGIKEEHSETYHINRHTRIGLPKLAAGLYPYVPQGLSALELAAKYGHQQVVAALLSRADVRADVEAAVGALFLAAQFDHVECLAVLLGPQSPVDANSRCDPSAGGFDATQGSFALHKAAYPGNLRAVRLLLSKGAQVHVRDNLQCLPLHLACLGACNTRHEERREIVRLMSGVLASSNAKDALDWYDAAGSTPLHYAVRAGLYGCCEVLLSESREVNRTLQMPVEGTGGYPGDDWRRRHCRLSDITLQVAGSTPMDLCMDRLHRESTVEDPQYNDALIATRNVLLRWAPIGGLCPGEKRPYRRR